MLDPIHMVDSTGARWCETPRRPGDPANQYMVTDAWDLEAVRHRFRTCNACCHAVDDALTPDVQALVGDG